MKKSIISIKIPLVVLLVVIVGASKTHTRTSLDNGGLATKFKVKQYRVCLDRNQYFSTETSKVQYVDYV